MASPRRRRFEVDFLEPLPAGVRLSDLTTNAPWEFRVGSGKAEAWHMLLTPQFLVGPYVVGGLVQFTANVGNSYLPDSTNGRRLSKRRLSDQVVWFRVGGAESPLRWNRGKKKSVFRTVRQVSEVPW